IKSALEYYNKACEVLIENINIDIKKSGEEPFLKNVEEKTAVFNTKFMTQVQTKLKEDLMYSILQNNIGICLALIGQVDKAKDAFKESIEFIPDGVVYEDPHLALQKID